MSIRTSSSASEEVWVCGRCTYKELRLLPRTMFDSIFSLRSYLCGRCAYHQRKFEFSRRSFASLLLLLTLLALPVVVVGGIAYFSMNRPFWPASGGALRDQAEVLARARSSSGGELSAFEQMMLRKSRTTMDNTTILKLAQAKVRTDVIVHLIRTSIADYDLTANSIIELKKAGVDEEVILAMIDESYRTR